MKRLIVLLLCLLLALPALAEKTTPEEHTSGDFTYVVLDDGTAQITRYSGNAEALEIPAELDGIAVTSIGDGAFSKCPSLTSITLPDGITSIGEAAFVNCSDLTSITLPDGLTSIGTYAFAYCYGLTSIALPDSVTDIGVNAFERCLNLTDIVVSPDHPTFQTIDGVLFSKPDKRLVCYPFALTAEAYEVPQDTQIIGECAFIYSSDLKSITLPDSVTEINDYAFSTCAGLMSVNLPGSVTSIGNGAFHGCDKLTLTVARDSYAAQYCEENTLNYIYPDSDD